MISPVVDSTPLVDSGRSFFFAAGISAGFTVFPQKYAEYLLKFPPLRRGFFGDKI